MAAGERDRLLEGVDVGDVEQRAEADEVGAGVEHGVGAAAAQPAGGTGRGRVGDDAAVGDALVG